ncbi:MAG TPA: DHH family phosphoesterase [Candidatus Nanoarchaeia archaeon]|nr:DHH family phosphoesterase [Candidatus Nanoarchaeia archaeon]
MLTEKDYERIRKELDECSKPLFFFDDDPDGLCSFLLLYRYKKEGRGIVVKTVPRLDAKFAERVEEYGPDKVFVLDVAVVLEEFVERVNVPIVWIDHHQPIELNRVTCINPMIKSPASNDPTSSICYNAVKQDAWIGAVGTVGDWHIPNFIVEFNKEYPDFKIGKISPGKALFDTKIGRIARIFSFLLKGPTKDVMVSVKVLSRISGPEEILEANTAQSKFLKNRYEDIEKKYEDLLQEAKKKAGKDKFIVFTYQADKWSFTSELSNELLYRYPKKIVIVGREKSGEIRMSLRSSKPILNALQKSLVGIEGYGGGHENACGANVKAEDFGRFLGNLRSFLM